MAGAPESLAEGLGWGDRRAEPTLEKVLKGTGRQGSARLPGWAVAMGSEDGAELVRGGRGSTW